MTPQKKTSHHIFKMAISSEFFGDVMIFIIRVNADKRIEKNSEIFSIKNREYTFVCFLSIQSLSEWCEWVGVKKSPKLCWRNIRMIPKRMNILLLFLTLYASEYKWNYVCQVYGFYTSMLVFCRIFWLFWNSFCFHFK